jgi:GxxExxY protein
MLRKITTQTKYRKMPVFDKNFIHSEISSQILKGYHNVYNQLGFGLDKALYIKALEVELRFLGCEFEVNKPIEIKVRGQKIGIINLDFLWTDKIIVQITTNRNLKEEDLDLLPALMKHSQTKVGLLLNFGMSPQYKRRVLN